MRSLIVVLPYTETSRLFNASSARQQEAFIGDAGVVYYESQAMGFDSKEDAEKAAKESGNNRAFVRELKVISLESIADRLAQSFTDMKKFENFDSKILNASSVTSRQISVISFRGLSLGIGIYTIGTEAEIENDTAKWFRFVEIFGQNKAYYF